MSDWSTFTSSFFGVFSAFIAKDFYDMFLRGRIRRFFKTYKLFIEKHIGGDEGAEEIIE